MMKNLILLLLIASVFWVGCHNVYYKVPPPGDAVAMEEMPANIKGVFLLEAFEGEDTVIIHDVGFTYDGEHILGQSTILKEMDGYYFVSMKDDSLDLWGTYLLKPLNDMELVMYDLDADEEGDLDAMKALTPVEEVLNDEGKIEYVIIDPRTTTIQEFLQLGLYKQVGTLRKVPSN